MKKIIAALTLFLAFSLSANAQEKKATKELTQQEKEMMGMTPAEKGKKQAAELSQFLGLDQTMTTNFAALFEQKFVILDDPNMTFERKTELSRVIEAKIRGSLDGNLMTKLDKNPELLKRLIN